MRARSAAISSGRRRKSRKSPFSSKPGGPIGPGLESIFDFQGIRETNGKKTDHSRTRLLASTPRSTPRLALATLLPSVKRKGALECRYF